MPDGSERINIQISEIADNRVTDTFTIPADAATGTYTLSLGVVDPAIGKPVVKLAIPARDKDGWYPLSRIDVVK